MPSRYACAVAGSASRCTHFPPRPEDAGCGLSGPAQRRLQMIQSGDNTIAIGASIGGIKKTGRTRQMEAAFAVLR